MESTTTFPAALRAALRAAGITQKELAERLGTSPATISMYLSGKQEPVVSRVEQIGEILGCVFRIPGYGQETTSPPAGEGREN